MGYLYFNRMKEAEEEANKFKENYKLLGQENKELKSQRDEARIAYNNLILDKEHIYIDEGISGRKADKRPAFQDMIKHAKKKEFDIILVHRHEFGIKAL